MKDITSKVKVTKLAWNDERANGYHHCPHIWKYNGKETILGAGTTDNVYFILHDDLLLLMSINSRYGYAGLEVYDPDTLEMVTEFFDQNPNDEFSPLFGRRDFFSYEWYTQARKLYSLAMEIA